jgi:hypothetical protein
MGTCDLTAKSVTAINQSGCYLVHVDKILIALFILYYLKLLPRSKDRRKVQEAGCGRWPLGNNEVP